MQTIESLNRGDLLALAKLGLELAVQVEAAVPYTAGPLQTETLEKAKKLARALRDLAKSL